jgi:hypothetical protein
MLSVSLTLFSLEWLNQPLLNLIYHDTWAHLNVVLHKSLTTVCVCVCVFPIASRQPFGKNLPIYARQQLRKNITADIHNSRRIVGRVVLYAVRVVSKESRRLVLPRTSCSLRD